MTESAEGAVHVFPDTTHVAPLATVQLAAARVVTLHVSVTPPTFTVAVIAVEKNALEVSRTRKVWPFVMFPAVPHVPPLIEICAPVPLTDTGVEVLMPVIVTVFAAVVSVLRLHPSHWA